MNRVLFFSLTIIFLASGCITSPQNGQSLNSYFESVQFAGLVPAGEVRIDVWPVFENGSPLTTQPLAQTYSDPIPHPQGGGWFQWSTHATMNFGLWEQVPGERKLRVRFKVMGYKPDTTGGGNSNIGGSGSGWIPDIPLNAHPLSQGEALAFFDYLGDDGEDTRKCWEDNKAGGPEGIINACGSNAPFLTLYLPCGADGQVCCKEDPTCDTTVCVGGRCRSYRVGSVGN